jgi:hypothetical protein
MSIFWNNIKSHYRSVGLTPYLIVIILAIPLGIYSLHLFTGQIHHVLSGIANGDSFLRVDNVKYASAFTAAYCLSAFPFYYITIKYWHIDRGFRVGRPLVNIMAVVSIGIGIVAKFGVDHLLTDAGYHACGRHEINDNPKGRMDKKFPPRIWVLDSSDCLEP